MSVVIPARNEAGHIRECLASVLASLDTAGGGEVLVVDGESTDGTRAVVEAIGRERPEVRLLDNPARITPTAFNRGIASARSERIAIISAHCTVDPGFFAAGHARLDEGSCDIVGGPIRSTPARAGALGWLLAQIVSHPFGVGNSRFRVARTAGYVDAVPFAIFRADVFRRIGMFNEALVRNQDTEFFGRAARAGVRVFLEPAMGSVYFARASLHGLLSQGFRNAYWNVLVWRMRPAAFQWRHLIPGLFTSGIVVGGLLALSFWWIGVLLGLALGLYAVLAVLASLQIARVSGRAAALALPPLFFLYHFCYGAGSLAGLVHLAGSLPLDAPTLPDPPHG